MIGFYARTIDDAFVRPYWAIRMWAARHPRWAQALALTLLVVVLVGQPMAAHAVTVVNPLVPGDLTDSYGIPLSNYAELPIDKGGITDPIKAMVSGLTAFFWAIHLALVSWMIWLCDWLLKFEWLNLLVVPFTTMAERVQEFLTRIGWIPMALTVAAAVGGVMLVAGKVGKGAQEMFVAVVVSLLATGVLANPVASITTAGGAMDKAREYGGSLSALVVSENFDDALNVTDPAAAISDSVTGQLADIFLRLPAQTVAFGGPLEGDPNNAESCAGIFADRMKNAPPAVEENTLKDDIRGCDEEAKQYSESLNFTAPIQLLFVALGSIAMFILPIALAVLLLTSVIGLLLSACKSMFWAYLAILPMNRYALWRSVMDTLFGLGAIIVVVVLLAGALKVISDTVVGLNDLGVGVLPTSLFSLLLVAVVVTLLVKAREGTLKSGNAIANAMSRWGASRGGGSAPSPVASMMTVGAALYGAQKLAPVGARAIKAGVNGVGNLAHKGHQLASKGRGAIWSDFGRKYPYPTHQGPKPGPNPGTAPDAGPDQPKPTTPLTPPPAPGTSTRKPVGPRPSTPQAPRTSLSRLLGSEESHELTSVPAERTPDATPHEIEVRQVEEAPRPLDQVRVNRRRIYTSGDGKPQVRRPKSTVVYDYTALQRSSARNRSAAAAQLRTTLEQARVSAEKAGDLHQRLAVRIGR